MSSSAPAPIYDLGGVWSSLSSGLGAVALPDTLAHALAAGGGDPAQGIPAGTPTDTRTRQQRAQDDATGAVYDPATDTRSSGTRGAWTYALPKPVQYVLFHDWLTGQDGRTEDTSVKSLLVLLVMVILGAGFIYFGVRTLAD